MNEDRVRDYILETFEGVNVIDDDGNSFFFYDTENRIPFVTIVTSDKYDSHSDLSRPGVYRLNIGTGKDIYRAMFQTDKIPTEAGYDFSAMDVVMPHPEYGRVYWVCVLNPSEGTFENVKPLIAEAYGLAVRKYNSARMVRDRPATG